MKFKSVLLAGICSVAVNLTGTASQSQEDCIRYAHDYSCIFRQDSKNPKIGTFKSIDMFMLADQDIFPFSGGKGIANDEEIIGGECYEEASA